MMKTMITVICTFLVSLITFAVSEDHENHVSLAATRLCEEEYNSEIDLNILQIVLETDPDFVIVPDDTAKIWYIFVSENGDAVNNTDPMDLIYFLGYNLGGYILPSSPCDYDQLKEDNREFYSVPYVVKKEGLYYKFHITLPTKKVWKVSQIVVCVSIRVKSKEREYNEVKKLTDIIYIDN